MSDVTQCNNCKKLTPRPAIGWFQITKRQQRKERSSAWDYLSGSSSSTEPVGDFCSLLCVSEYATVEALDPAPEAP